MNEINDSQYTADLIAIAVKSGSPTEQINKLIEMRDSERVQDARKKYLRAISNFQFDCPILKKKTSVFVSDDIGSRSYFVERLSDITQEIKPILHKHGLSYRWEIALNDKEKDMITCTCIISHIDGHYEETTISAEVDSSSEVKNKIQQRGSTISYLHRLTLKSALGITTSDDESENASGKAKNGIQTGNGKVVDLPIANKIPISLDANKSPIPNEDYVRITNDIASFNTEKEVLDYYYSWEKKYGNSIIFRNMLRNKISILPTASRLSKEQKDAYRKPEKIIEYE